MHTVIIVLYIHLCSLFYLCSICARFLYSYVSWLYCWSGLAVTLISAHLIHCVTEAPQPQSSPLYFLDLTITLYLIFFCWLFNVTISGADRFIKDIEIMIGNRCCMCFRFSRSSKKWWKFCWKLLTPGCLIVITFEIVTLVLSLWSRFYHLLNTQKYYGKHWHKHLSFLCVNREEV